MRAEKVPAKANAFGSSHEPHLKTMALQVLFFWPQDCTNRAPDNLSWMEGDLRVRAA